jgi:hypothetical protein
MDGVKDQNKSPQNKTGTAACMTAAVELEVGIWLEIREGGAPSFRLARAGATDRGDRPPTPWRVGLWAWAALTQTEVVRVRHR